MDANEIPNGVWPAMITPLQADKSIDWGRVDALTDWYIDSGVAGLFAVGQSSEMFKLSDDERLALARRVVDGAGGRVPVVATGTFGGPIAQQAEFIKYMADTGVRAVTVIASAMAAENEDDRVLKNRLGNLLDLTDDLPLALYECPEPYHRFISPGVLAWAAQSGRFLLMKGTSRSLQDTYAKIEATAGTSLKFFNADATTLLPSLKAGACGYCGIAANFYPDIVAWLCKQFRNQPEIAEQTQAVMGVADMIIHHKYPVCAKYFRQQAGFDMLTISRVTDSELNDYEMRVLDYVSDRIDALRQLHQANPL